MVGFDALEIHGHNVREEDKEAAEEEEEAAEEEEDAAEETESDDDSEATP